MIPFASVTQPPRATPTTSIIETLPVGSGSGYDFYRIPVRIAVSARPYDSLLGDLSKLEQGWDGYGGLAPSLESCMHARGFLSAIPEGMGVPEVSPTPNGTVAFEWESNAGDAYLEIGRTRYSGHIHQRDGKKVYIQGQLTSPAQQKLVSDQVLVIVKQLLYAASASEFSTHTIQITEPAF